MKIGIIKEGKVPPDRRVPFTPKQLFKLKENYGAELEFLVQSSEIRCFQDEEYRQVGIEVVDDIGSCDVLMGIKEVPIDQLIPNKTYFFFSHTFKKQPYNRKLLKAILEKNIELIDYEVVKNDQGERLVAFGRWAGIVGAYNGFWAYGKKSGLYALKRAMACHDRLELNEELQKIQLPPIKIVVTGKGRVGKGVREVLDAIKIKEVSPHDLVHHYYDEPVFALLSSSDYNRRKTDGGYDKNEFYTYPEKYESHFLKFAEVSDILIGAAFWDYRAPRLFELEDIRSDDFNISVIADITCDIDGSIPTTLKASTPLDPVYDIDRQTLQAMPAFGKQNSISVMAIDNLPSELPRDASEDFGDQLTQYVIPELLKETSTVLDRATVTKEGDLTVEFIYLRDFVNDAPQDF
ncbi:NAD(P)-dependent oxidoreductase [Rhodonellum sp.]|uniref:NAD(P)-dependent oxidoreductase n=1 Tax=Rhodonellum sp. TaxID=2231180 RepID=UPI0027244838|nr:NAD(P)-dependent oxidoreductase [Rhodonellum sp.]MDO9552704.1 NAD(P)-dependent oxidoreductase [Rhodonellum sp.]